MTIEILHISPFRLPFEVNWDAVSEFPGYAADVISTGVKAVNRSSGLKISQGYKKIYDGGALYDEITEDRLPYCFEPVFVAHAPPHQGRAVDLAAHDIVRDMFGSDGKVNITGVAFSLYGFNHGVLQFIAEYEDATQICGHSGNIGHAFSGALIKRHIRELISISTVLSKVEREIALPEKDAGRIFSRHDNRQTRKALSLLHYVEGQANALWTHRFFFAPDEVALEEIAGAGVSLSGVDPVELPLTDGDQIIGSDGKSVYLGSAASFFAHEIDHAARGGHLLYAYYDALRMSAEILKIRLGRATRRRQFQRISGLIHSVDQYQDLFNQQLPAYGAGLKNPRLAVFNLYRRVFRFDAVRESADIAINSTVKANENVERGFEQRVQKRSQLALYVISFLSLIGLAFQVLWYAKGGFNVDAERAVTPDYVRFLEVIQGWSSEVFLMSALAITLFASIFLARRG